MLFGLSAVAWVSEMREEISPRRAPSKKIGRAGERWAGLAGSWEGGNRPSRGISNWSRYVYFVGNTFPLVSSILRGLARLVSVSFTLLLNKKRRSADIPGFAGDKRRSPPSPAVHWQSP